MILFALLSAALAAETRSLSLAEALDIADGEASESLTMARADLSGAEADLRSAMSYALPTVSASGSYQHTFQTEFEALFPEGSGFGGGTSPLGAANTYRVGFSASQVLYAGGSLKAGYQAADAARDSAALSVEQQRASIALNTIQAYYNAVLTERLYGIATDTLARAERTLADAQLGAEVGRTSEFEVLRAEVEVENQRVMVLRQQLQRDTARLMLCQALDLPSDTQIVLTSALDEDSSREVSRLAASHIGVSDDTRLELEKTQTLVSMAEAGVALARAGALPSLAASGNYGWATFPSDLFPPPPGDDWYDNVSVGLSLSVPIFGGGRNWAELQSAKAQLDATRALQDQMTELAELDRQQAQTLLAGAEAQYAATAATIDQAQRAYEIAEVRYNEGISPQGELADARLLLQQAEINRAVAQRDLLLARARIALLPALPLGSY